MKREQTDNILHDLQKKMVLILGPRQAGKTWIAKHIAPQFEKSVYFNVDNIQDREAIEAQAWSNNTELLVFDELHKLPNWKNYLKGVYDTKPDHLKILVTGSASMEAFAQVGDSLAGRYFMHRLMPLSPAELKQVGEPVDIDRLLLRGGFPEPYLAETDVDAARWRQQYLHSMTTTDVLDFDGIHNTKAIRILVDLLRHNVGSNVSARSLSEKLAVSPTTVSKYINILEELYIIFRVTPYSRNIARSILKDPKLYFFDTGLVVGDEGAKLENTVAVSLLKHVYLKNDLEAKPYRLHYLRTKEGREVDFALVNEDAIEQIIEVKRTDQSIAKGLYYFAQKYQLPAAQLVKTLRYSREHDGIQLHAVDDYLSRL